MRIWFIPGIRTLRSQHFDAINAIDNVLTREFPGLWASLASLYRWRTEFMVVVGFPWVTIQCCTQHRSWPHGCSSSVCRWKHLHVPFGVWSRLDRDIQFMIFSRGLLVCFGPWDLHWLLREFLRRATAGTCPLRSLAGGDLQRWFQSHQVY